MHDAHERIVNGLRLRNETRPTVEDYTADVVRSHIAQVRAAQLFKKGHPRKALDQVKLAAHHSQGIKETFNNLGALLAEEDLPDLAVEYFQKALDLRGDYHLGRRNLVITLRRLARHEEALDISLRGLARHPDDAVLFEEAVRSAVHLRASDQVKLLCRARMKVAPDDPSPHKHLGRFARDQEGSVVLAETHLREAARLDPKDRSTRIELAEIEGKLGAPPGLPDALADAKDPFALVSNLVNPTVGEHPDLLRADPPDRRRRRLSDLPSAPIPGNREFRSLLATLRPPTGLTPSAPRIPSSDLSKGLRP